MAEKKKKPAYPVQQPAYPVQQAGAYPTQQGYPAQPGYPQQQGYPPVHYPHAAAAGGFQPTPPPGYAPQGPQGPPPPYTAQPQNFAAPPMSQPPMPPAQLQQGGTLVVQGGFDAGARNPTSIPPPPPGYAPNHAQMAATQGQNVVVTQRQGNWMTGGSDGGYVVW
ncbi:uncharacterized protein [Antedon mediterranea]|uniref:uncharacterized protein isoform X2 n=1 Tax=Antedon mediterranea TaxID=105859 RepID=UPI003AF6EF2E